MSPRNSLNKPAEGDEAGARLLTEQNVRAIIELEEAAKLQRTPGDRTADRICRFCGSMAFVWTHVGFFAFWITANVVPGIPPFDHYPFGFLTLIVSLEAIFLSTFILISQNHETRLAERRAHLCLQINILAEQENARMLLLVKAILAALGESEPVDPEVDALSEEVRPEALLEQIVTASEDFHEKPGGGND